MTTFRNQNILLGFSGGADSTAAALLLQQQGYNVVGFYFSVLNNTAAANEEKNNVNAIARQLNIQILNKDMSEEFNEKVIHPFCEAYRTGSTPNPCVLCNPLIKFKALYATAEEIGFNKIATGHYARIYNNCEGTTFVRRAENIKKDQSYALYRLSSELLSHIIFPLGEIHSKEDTRQILKNHKISNAETKDSQDICFIKSSSYKDFLNQNGIISSPGDYIDKNGKILGTHQGIANYTIGQRKGLGKAFGKPMFVTGLNQNNNTVILGEEKELYKDSVTFSNLFFTAYGDCLKLPSTYENTEVYVKLRYTAQPAKALLYQQTSEYPLLKFTEPQKSPTPGQSAVLYQNDIIIGGGVII
jgi:tRNA-specific 2-thiouridylase